MNPAPFTADHSGRGTLGYILSLINRLEAFCNNLNGFNGVRVMPNAQGGADFQLSAPVTVDLAGVVHGPWSAAAGQFVKVDTSAATCTQQSIGTVRPSVVPQNEVWIDLSQTVGRVYITRIG